MFRLCVLVSCIFAKSISNDIHFEWHTEVKISEMNQEHCHFHSRVARNVGNRAFDSTCMWLCILIYIYKHMYMCVYLSWPCRGYLSHVITPMILYSVLCWTIDLFQIKLNWKLWPLYAYNGKPHTWKESFLYWDGDQLSFSQMVLCSLGCIFETIHMYSMHTIWSVKVIATILKNRFVLR